MAAFDLKSIGKSRWKDWDQLAAWLSNELDMAFSARQGRAEEVAYAWAYYEQARMRHRAPWPDAADLPSPFAAEYTDAVHARLMQTVFVEPVWTVEGWGDSAKRAPYVEEFHQRAQEDERLQGYLDEWILRALIESVGTLKVMEGVEWRREKVEKRVNLQIDPETGQPLYGENGPMLESNPETGALVEAQTPEEPSAETEMDELRPVRIGPSYEVVPYNDFYVLPAHARHRDSIWAYACRFYRRKPELLAASKRGMYAEDAVKGLSDADERSGNNGQGRELPDPSVTVVDQQQNTAQKELYEIQALLDLDGKGERWWVLTLHKESRTLLRARVDDGLTRFIRWMPFPKPGSVDHGYSLVGNKLITVLEEDTARRNMKADRMALKVGQPMGRLQGALWDPFTEPWGPRAVINMRTPQEVFPIQGIEDVPQSVHLWGPEIRGDADRLIGQNDTSLGTDTEESRTLGEVQLRAGYAEVRINVLVKRMQEQLEELGAARHEIWKRTLRAHPDLPPKRSMVIGRAATGIHVEGFPEDLTVTADLLDGVFWFKPRGSVETADLNRAKADLVGLLNILPGLMQMNPAFAAILGTLPAAKSIFEQVLRVFRWPDRQSFLGPEVDDVFSRLQAQQQMAAMQQDMLADPRMQVLMGLAGGAAAPQLGPGGPQGPPPEQAGPPQGPPMGVQ